MSFIVDFLEVVGFITGAGVVTFFGAVQLGKRHRPPGQHRALGGEERSLGPVDAAMSTVAFTPIQPGRRVTPRDTDRVLPHHVGTPWLVRMETLNVTLTPPAGGPVQGRDLSRDGELAQRWDARHRIPQTMDPQRAVPADSVWPVNRRFPTSQYQSSGVPR